MATVSDITASDWMILRVISDIVRSKKGQEVLLDGALRDVEMCVCALSKKYGHKTILTACEQLRSCRRQEDKDIIDKAISRGAFLLGDEPPAETWVTALMEDGTY